MAKGGVDGGCREKPKRTRTPSPSLPPFSSFPGSNGVCTPLVNSPGTSPGDSGEGKEEYVLPLPLLASFCCPPQCLYPVTAFLQGSCLLLQCSHRCSTGTFVGEAQQGPCAVSLSLPLSLPVVWAASTSLGRERETLRGEGGLSLFREYYLMLAYSIPETRNRRGGGRAALSTWFADIT